VELVTLRVEATGHMPPPVTSELAPSPMPPPEEERLVHFALGSQLTPVFARDRLGAGTRFPGPAILTQLDATTLIPPGWTAEVHASGSILLSQV
jgi:N-methylhydantoinase A